MENVQPFKAGSVVPPKAEPKAKAEKTRVVSKFGDEQVISKTDITPTYREGSKRGKIYASIKPGMTVKGFMDANGGRAVASTFLTWYVATAKVLTVK